MNEDWIYFKLQHKENSNVELIGCIDLSCIDDDEPNAEWMQNDGRWEQAIPNYCSINNVDYSFELEELKDTLYQENSIINQYLVDWSDNGGDALYSHKFNNCILYCSYDEDKVYDAEMDMVVDKKTTIQVTQSTKDKLSALGAKGDTYDEIINRILNDLKAE